jgi:hypothetical protein
MFKFTQIPLKPIFCIHFQKVYQTSSSILVVVLHEYLITLFFVNKQRYLANIWGSWKIQFAENSLNWSFEHEIAPKKQTIHKRGSI